MVPKRYFCCIETIFFVYLKRIFVVLKPYLCTEMSRCCIENIFVVPKMYFCCIETIFVVYLKRIFVVLKPYFLYT